MLEYFILLLFMVNLFLAIIFDISIVLALFANLMLLIFYAFIKDYKLKEIFEMVYQGLLETKTILFVFILIGMITGIWRLSGTIAYIIYYGTGLISPKFFYVGVFIFNSLISLLTGTSLGTASTSGIISMSISTAMNFNPLISGGAILSGCYFGDRSSPMSTSALLVATLTKTDLYENLKNMFRTCVIPLILTLISFQIFNFGSEAELNYDSLKSIADMFNFNFLLIIPTLSIILLAILKVDIRLNLIISIVLSIIFAVIFQDMGLGEIFRALIFGFHIDSEIGRLINGGGLLSMKKMLLIVGISSGYFGFFKHTDLLMSIKKYVNKMFEILPDMVVMSLISLIIAAFSANQTLTSMITYEMARENYEDPYKLALDLENSAIMTPLYIPWNITGRSPMELVGGPISAILFSFYHHYIVLVNTIISIRNFKKNK
ncbi:Na+/H+ antiporter NhaC family protein [Peptoniphilus phoceensis]|uniref:Na+/H+ antiporter NhaC family protein n=1 Tax=Peptoniphilus phoceensis TaxID=1720298 RepID=UPI000782B7F0|nr:Na+/H+ antiporter NhaC family protein [Peptoniphilus phoceensis]